MKYESEAYRNSVDLKVPIANIEWYSLEGEPMNVNWVHSLFTLNPETKEIVFNREVAKKNNVTGEF